MATALTAISNYHGGTYCAELGAWGDEGCDAIATLWWTGVRDARLSLKQRGTCDGWVQEDEG
jgi:hypothetical protein